MRSTFRRYATATPASVHCMSPQFVFGDLSCTGLRTELWNPRNHELFTIHRIISHWIIVHSFWVCIICLTWIIWISQSDGFGPGRELPEDSDSGIASVSLLSASCGCCFVCFRDDSHQRDARHPHHCEDRSIMFVLYCSTWQP